MPKPPVATGSSSLPSGARHRSDASALGDLAGSQTRGRTKAVKPRSVGAAPQRITQQPTAPTPQKIPTEPTDSPKIRLADLRVSGEVYDDFERTLKLIQNKIGWRVNKTEVLTAVVQLIVASEPTAERRPAPSTRRTRPANQDAEAKASAEHEVAVWLHQLLRDSEVVT